MREFSKIFSDVTKTIGSSGFQFLITMFTTPVMTRLYDPAAYATFGIINTAATALIGIGFLSLPNAYPLENKSSARHELIQLMLLMLLGLVALAGIISAGIGAADAIYAGEHFSDRVLILFPFVVLTLGLRQIMTSVATERANFSSLAIGQMVEPICSRGGSIVLGALLGGRPGYILMSVIVGNIAATVTVFKMVANGTFHKWRALFTKMEPMEVLLRYSDFVIYNTASQQAQSLALLGLQMGIAAYFSSHDAGHYILAVSVITLPATLIALATAPVVYRHFIEVERNDDSRLLRHLMVTMGFYLLGGFVILAPVYFFGEEIFKFVFGDIWGHAGVVASYLSIAYVTSFPVIGIQSIFRVTGHLKVQFLLEVGTCTFVLLVALICFKTMVFDLAIIYLSAAWFLRNAIMLLACVMVTLKNQKSRISL